MKRPLWMGAVIGTALTTGRAIAEERFPPPEFETGYKIPALKYPLPKWVGMEYLDVALLLVALAVGTYLVYTKRSRRGLALLSILSLFYFGFYREGCVCAIGSIQNVALALGQTSYQIPLHVVGFFVLPLLFALFFGRTFCAAVCPHGAIQELVVWRPVQVPRWLEHALGLLAYVYLGAAVLFAATGTSFILCQYDPFIAIFRLSGGFEMFLLGGCFLVIGLFVGRPYCRFLCPLGVLLGLFSHVSQKRVTIYPDHCVQCRLCEDSCPYNAIREPTIDDSHCDNTTSRRRLLVYLALAPVLLLLFGFLGSQFGAPMARAHATVQLQERLEQEDRGAVDGTTDASTAFRDAGRSRKELAAATATIQRRFHIGGWLLGLWVGLVVAVKLIGLSVRRGRDEYEADRGACVACGRCFPYCPADEDVRLQALASLEAESVEVRDETALLE
ncbi:MAG: hypothetical protein AUJ92_16495 [Armatimonadetes bacterium CG2_30_59_28]|nr:4Fe-4S binding protein [Armatimonadota bacterium]OIO91474.1 MAG: hypothetical protein AUJ92_16495 [Armatimonadetes bacterium CG2_30_59_28]